MNNSTFAILVVGAAIVGGVVGHKLVGHMPDRFGVFGFKFVRKVKKG